MEEELGGEIMKEFLQLKAKSQIYLLVNAGKRKQAKITKKCVIKRKLKFKDYKNRLNKSNSNCK